MLRRMSIHLSQATQSETRDLIGPLLIQSCRRALDDIEARQMEEPTDIRASTYTYDAVLRLDFACGGKGTDRLFRAATLCALHVGIEGVKEEVLRVWHVT